MKRTMVTACVLTMLLGSLLTVQAGAQTFAVASIRPSSQAVQFEHDGRTEVSPGLLQMHDVTVATCVKWAYGVQDSQIIFLLLTDKGIRALMDSQFKFGGDASVAVATIGAGVQGSTTTALRADIVAFAQTRGLFAGLSLEGTLLSQRSEWNQIYYGQALSPQQVVLNGQGQNPGAEPLKEMLGRMAAE